MPRSRVSRRQFMRWSALTTTATIAAACGAAPAAPAAPTDTPAAAEAATTAPAAATPTTAPATQPAAGEPQYGGTYRIISSGFRSLDAPAAEVSADWWIAGTLLYSFLYAYDRDGILQPDLAADMPTLSDDATVYTIPLKKGVAFHNGRTMTAEDVKYSLDRSLWPDVYSWGKQFMENIVGYDEVIEGTTQDVSGIRVIDDFTIEITLKEPQAVFPAILSMTMNGIIPKQESIDAGEAWGVTEVIGTGPFKFVEWVQGQRVVLERNPNYFIEGLPYLDRVEVYLDIEPSVAMMRWEANEVDRIGVPAPDRERVLTEPEFEPSIRRGQGLGCNRLFFHMDSEVFQDIRVRQAIAMAIDKEALVRQAGGLAVALEGIYVPQMPQFDETFVSQYQYDPQQARALLAEAGYPDGIKGIRASGYLGQIEMVQADLAEIGVEIEVQISTVETFDMYRAGQIPFGQHSWGASFPDGFDYVSGWVTCASAEAPGTYNFGKYCNPRIDELMAEAEGLPLLDPQRLALYREIEDIAVNEDVAIIGLTTGLGLALSKPHIHDDVTSSIFGHPLLLTTWMEQ